MDAASQIKALAALYGPSASSMAERLPDLADSIHTQLMALHGTPCASYAVTVANSLYHLRLYVQRIGDTVRREVEADE